MKTKRINWRCTSYVNVHSSCSGHTTKREAFRSVECEHRFGRVTRMILKEEK